VKVFVIAATLAFTIPLGFIQDSTPELVTAAQEQELTMQQWNEWLVANKDKIDFSIHKVKDSNTFIILVRQKTGPVLKVTPPANRVLQEGYLPDGRYFKLEDVTEDK
jgi:hypothetical protein